MQEGDPSHALYVKERQDLLDSLHRRASQLYKSLNQLEGITCNEPEGALYCMPRIRLSKKALEVCLSIVTLPLGLQLAQGPRCLCGQQYCSLQSSATSQVLVEHSPPSGSEIKSCRFSLCTKRSYLLTLIVISCAGGQEDWQGA